MWKWVALLILFAASDAWAQGPTSVQNTPTELRASTVCADSRPSAGSAGSASLTPPAGNFLYVNSVEINAAASQGAAGTLSTPASASTTNFPGSITSAVFPIQAQAGGVAIGNFFYAYSGNGLKALAPGTATTITTPALTNVTWHISLCGYYAP